MAVAAAMLDNSPEVSLVSRARCYPYVLKQVCLATLKQLQFKGSVKEQQLLKVTKTDHSFKAKGHCAVTMLCMRVLHLQQSLLAPA